MDTPQRRFDRTWQPRLWLRLAGLILIVAYVIAFVVGNNDETSVNFVVGKATTSLIWVILLSLLAGPARRCPHLAAPCTATGARGRA